MLKRGHESIVSIDSMTHTELACLDLTIHSYSYKYPTMYTCHMVDRDYPLCARIPRVPVSRDLAHRPELVGVIRTLRVRKYR